MAKFDYEEPDTFKVATIDIESLSTRMRPAVTEIGYVICELPKGCDYGQWRGYVTESGTLQLDLLEQLKLGRHVDPDTIDFQERTFGKEEYRSMIYEQPKNGNPFYYAEAALRKLKGLLKGVDELWMNHPTFDSGRLHTLAEDVGIFGGLWYYGCEQDIATLKEKHGLEMPVKDPNAHRGLNDCYYNLNILHLFSQTRVPKWVRTKGYVWTEAREQITFTEGEGYSTRSVPSGSAGSAIQGLEFDTELLKQYRAELAEVMGLSVQSSTAKARAGFLRAKIATLEKKWPQLVIVAPVVEYKDMTPAEKRKHTIASKKISEKYLNSPEYKKFTEQEKVRSASPEIKELEAKVNHTAPSIKEQRKALEEKIVVKRVSRKKAAK